MEHFAELCARFPKVVWEREFSFARHTTIGCGGTASLAASPADLETAAELIAYLRRSHIPHCFLGAGANVLPADGRFEGVVVRFCRLKTLYADGETIYAGAGVTGGALLRFAEANGLGGLECFTGIPMTVGGGVTMNAGVAEKTSIFGNGTAVIGAYLKGSASSPQEIAERRAHFRAARAHLPRGRSMGCVFVNPEGDFAGRLIAQCGLKGTRVGGAVVSCGHGNFILNEGGTSADVSALIALIREEVLRQTGILLREEIRRLP